MKEFEPYSEEEVKQRDKNELREEISISFEEFLPRGTPFSSFTIFEAGYRVGMIIGDK